MVLSRLTKITGPGVSTDTNWVGNNADFTGITTSATSFNIGVTTIHSTLAELHNIKSTGIITATGGSFSGNVTAVDGTFSGNVSIAGTLTYEDVTNIDSVGIITARSGLASPYADVDDFVSVGSNIHLGNAGVITATSFVGDGSGLIGVASTDNIVTGTAATFTGGVDINSDLDVDGHTNLDNVSVAGVTTFASNVFLGDNDRILFGDSGLSDAHVRFDGTHLQFGVASGQFRVSADTSTFVNYAGTQTLATINSTGVSITNDLTLTDTTADSAAGPEFKLFRNSASPADADYLGQIKFAGESDTGVERNYAKITGKILDASNGTEDGIIEIAHIKAGSQTITGRWRSDSLQLLNSTNFSVAGTAEVTGTATFTGNILPSSDSATDIGTNSVRFRNFYADTLYGDGSNLTGITGTTINNNANNRIITGSGTANTLEGEANLTWDGSSFSATAGTGNQFPFQIRNDFTPNSQRADYGYLANATSNNSLRLGSINSNGGVTIQSTRMNDSAQKHDLHLNPDGGDVSIGGVSPSSSALTVKIATNKHIGFSPSQSEVGNVPALVAFQDNGSLTDIGFRGTTFRVATASAERFRITSNGHVLIGTSSGSEQLVIKRDDAVGPTITLENDSNLAYINNWGSTGGGSGRRNRFEINATSQAQASICAPYITFMPGGTGDSYEKVRITSDELRNSTQFYSNKTTIASNKTITTDYNHMTIGNMTINSGVTVTVNSGARWVIV